MRLSASSAVVWTIAVLLVGLGGYVLFFLSDPVDALKSTGPFSGRVVSAETNSPIRGAYVLAGWAGSIAIHGGGCAGGTIVRTDDEGRFYIPWQGMNVKWLLHDRLAPGGLTVWAVDYAPWNLSLDTPPSADGTRPGLPSGSVFSSADLGTIKLAKRFWEDYGLEDTRRMSNCADATWFEQTADYLAYRSKWARVCSVGDPQQPASGSDLEYLQKWMMRLPVRRAKKDTTTEYGKGNQPVDPELVSADRKRRADIDELAMLIYAPHEGMRPKSIQELADADRKKACELLDVHVQGMPE